MNIIIWLVVGGVIGWVASLIMRTDARQGLLLNVVVGIVGAVLGGWFLNPLSECRPSIKATSAWRARSSPFWALSSCWPS